MPTRFRELDGLRGLAALAVVLHHVTGGYQSRYPDSPQPLADAAWGAYGVQLFFLISGFVILLTAQRAQRPSDFVISRVSRLYPVYWAAVTLSIALAAAFHIAAVPQGTIVHLLNYTMIQRWLLVPNVDDVYWTLAIEMQFYALIFCLLLLTRCRLTGRTVTIVAGVWMSIALGVAIWAGPMTRGLDPQAVAGPVKIVLNLVLAEWAPLFSVGMFACLARSRPDRRVGFGVLAGISAVLGAAVAAILHSAAQGWIVLGLAAFFLTVVARKSTSPLLFRPVQWYGKVSYSMYIGHNLAAVVIITLVLPYVGRNWAMLVAMVGVTLVAWGLHTIGEVHGTSLLKAALRSARTKLEARLPSRAMPS